jgi:tryptophanyl-tRNA synthetase
MSHQVPKPVMLTGDRPTGALHLGHYIGSLRNRVAMQSLQGERYIMIADTQAFTDNMGNIDKVTQAIPELIADYIGVGVDPGKTTIFLQSAVPELVELTMLYMNVTTVSRLERNPTVRDEIKHRQFERDIPAGFLCYPVAQAADITGLKATIVPVGGDQLPMIEIAVETVRRINRLAGKEILPEPQAMLSSVQRLAGIDGKAKASKSLNNAIFLSDDEKTVSAKVMQMFTDPNHLKVTDPGQVEGNIVFEYLDAFHANKEEIEGLKAHYRAGGVGDVKIKRLLISTLNDLIQPIKEERDQAFVDKDRLFDILRQGSAKAREAVGQTLNEVKDGLGLFRL